MPTNSVVIKIERNVLIQKIYLFGVELVGYSFMASFIKYG